MDKDTHPIDRIGICAEQIRFMAITLSGLTDNPPQPCDEKDEGGEMMTLALVIAEKAEQIEADVSLLAIGEQKRK